MRDGQRPSIEVMRSLGRPQSPSERWLDPIGAKPVVGQDRRVLTSSLPHALLEL